MPLMLISLSMLLLGSLWLGYLTFNFIRRIDFCSRTEEAGNFSREESLILWRLIRSCLPASQRQQWFNQLDSLGTLLGEIDKIKARKPAAKSFYSGVESKLHLRCSLLDRARPGSYQQLYNSTQELPSGLQIELYLKGSSSNYRATILEQDNQGLIISYPCNEQGKTPASWRGRPVLFSFCHRDAGIYRFASEFDSKYFDRHFTSLRLLHSNSFILNQKRKHHRHHVHLRAWAALNPDAYRLKKVAHPQQKDQKVALGKQSMIPCSITDLSCSGLRLRFEEKIYCRSYIALAVPLLGVNLRIEGKVCGLHHFNDSTIVGVQFQQLDPAVRYPLYQFLYGPRQQQKTTEEQLAEADS